MQQSAIGSSYLRQEAYLKVTGEASYLGDIKLPNCLEGNILRSPYPHAKIINIDVSEAKKLPGVFAVITGRDLPDRRYGINIGDQQVLARDRVLFVGDRVAAVAAIDADTALEALNLIKVEYEELSAVVDPLAAMQPGALLLHPQLPSYRNAPTTTTANVVGYATYGIGDIDVGFQEADYIYEHTFSTQVVHQGYIEPHGCIVQIASDQTVKVWSPHKAPFELRNQLASLLSLAIEKVEVVYPFIGGDFGGKGAIMDEPVAYYLALASQRPVRIIMTTAEELFATNPRHASVITLKSGVRQDGTLVARSATVIFDSGAYGGANANPLVFGVRRVLGAYRIPNTHIEGFAVYTNSVPAGHCRAPGDPQVFFAVETHTDLIAKAVGLDPYEFRRRNVLQEGDLSPSGLKWSGINAVDVLKTAVENSEWNKPKRSPFSGRGIALTERMTGVGSSAAVVTIHPDGTVTVGSGSTDPGTGSRTVLRQIAAQELQMPVDRVGFSGGNTTMVPFDNGSGSSRVTYVTGQAVIEAARDSLNQIKQLLAVQFGVPTSALIYQDGVFATEGMESLSLRDALGKIGKAKNVIVGCGSFVAEKMPCTCFAAQVAEVEVDPDTGHVTVSRIVSVNDIGFAINPLAVKSQVEGSVVQGLGFALNEELPHRGGQPLVKSLSDYKMATTLDAPNVESILLEGAPSPGPYGAKAIGEQAISAVAPAIANAIYDAIGVCVFDLPILPEKILQALGDKETVGENIEV
ncbi:xanthine dehydrogenase family protein molybdopterin-binding subunit [Paradesulfitobacterium aromaticivorans]